MDENGKETVKSGMSQLDPESLECLNCGSDVDVTHNDGYKYCPYCGQKIR